MADYTISEAVQQMAAHVRHPGPTADADLATKIKRAASAMRLLQECSGFNGDDEFVHVVMADVLADFRHLAEMLDVDYDEIDRRSERYFRED